VKVLLIGVDALDAAQVERLIDDLPHLARLRQRGRYARFGSVWPPDSETAWASIYTGLNPARHGIFQFVDPLEKTASYVIRERDNAAIRGRTFWDIAGAAGRRVCVLLPHIGYPAWAVNGVMVARASVGDAISIAPSAMADRYDLRGLNAVKGLAGRQRAAYLQANRRQVERQLELSVQLLCQEEWDLCFTYWSALDLVQHQFWSYCDPADPDFPGDTRFRHAIRDFYALHDRVIGTLISAVDEETSVVILSDHGHGMRPPKILNINRLLHERGLLALQRRSGTARSSVVRWAAEQAMGLAGRYELGDVAAKILRWAPWTKQLYMSSSDLDLERTVAYITDMSGIKAYSYGGIRILRDNLDGRSYASVRHEIVSLLRAVRRPDGSGEPVVRWVKPREALYDGPYSDAYPDLVFELDPDYGAGWHATGPLFEVSASHNLYPGTHLGNNAVFLLAGPDAERVARAPASMMDIAPTILDMLGVPVPGDLDGASILDGGESGPAPPRRA
jgi:predicted AlkP superfamily phosphohydrolase/phosphomutase